MAGAGRSAPSGAPLRVRGGAACLQGAGAGGAACLSLVLIRVTGRRPGLLPCWLVWGGCWGTCSGDELATQTPTLDGSRAAGLVVASASPVTLTPQLFVLRSHKTRTAFVTSVLRWLPVCTDPVQLRPRDWVLPFLVSVPSNSRLQVSPAVILPSLSKWISASPPKPGPRKTTEAPGGKDGVRRAAGSPHRAGGAGGHGAQGATLGSIMKQMEGDGMTDGQCPAPGPWHTLFLPGPFTFAPGPVGPSTTIQGLRTMEMCPHLVLGARR